MELRGKTALVTGGAVRLGKAICLALAEAGVSLAIHYHSSRQPAEEVLGQAAAFGVKAALFQADLSDPNTADGLVADAGDEFGSLDILVNNAGLYGKGRGMATTLPLIEEQFSVNLFSPLLLTRAFAAQVPEDGQGKVINIADAKVLQVGYDHFAYRLTKGAIIQMTRMFALELAPRITVNAIAPGVMMPLAGFEDQDMSARAERLIPLKRIGAPELIAQNVLHLLEQDFMTGVILPVDGGENL
jgi:glucose 1-dehydrogenase